MHQKLLLLLLCYCVVGLQTAVVGQVVEWNNFKSVGDIRDIAVANNVIWAGSSGGAIRLTAGDTKLSQIKNTEGLTQNDVVAVVFDNQGRLWLGLQNGILNSFSPPDDSVQVIEDYKDQQITGMVAFGDSLYIGLGIGVSLFTLDKMEVKETYQNLGLSTGGNFEKIGANSVYIDNKDIWVATNKGIAKSSLTLSNLQAPSNWTAFTKQDGLPSDIINGIVVLDGVPYAATNRGVSRLTESTWTSAGFDATSVSALQVAGPNTLFSKNTLIALTSSGVFWLTSENTWQRLGAGFSDANALRTTDSGEVWIGRKDKGLADFDFAENEWHLTLADAPASNDFKSLLIDKQGRLWCASRTGGIHLFDGENWTNLSRSNGLPSNDYRTLLEDHEGQIWAGSWGGGITIISETDDSFSFTKIDTVGGVLAGFSATDPDFVLVTGLARDPSDNIWILNREAINNRVLASRTPEAQYAYFSTGTIINQFLTSIEIDASGRVWLGTEGSGVQVIDTKGTLFDPNDDLYGQGLNAGEDGLYSNGITDIAMDRDGAMWIGTDVGLNVWFDQEVANEFDTPVNAIGVDAINNKWIGTQNGITILRGHRDKIGDLTVGNSELVSGNVQSFAFNSTTGDVWIGTDNGLSRAQTLFTAPKEDLSQLTGFPNPFLMDAPGKKFTITNLAAGSTVVIYNSAGKLIKTLAAFIDVVGGQAKWDGTNKHGKPVASGIYVYLAHTETNLSASGKLALVRK